MANLLLPIEEAHDTPKEDSGKAPSCAFVELSGKGIHEPRRMRRTEPLPPFELFPASETFVGTAAALDIKSHTLARHYRKRLQQTLSKNPEPNFAGQYLMVDVRCGSPCYDHIVVDLRTGAVLDSLGSSVGASYRRDSRLVLVNPAPVRDCGPRYPLWCETVAYVFEPPRFLRVESTAGLEELKRRSPPLDIRVEKTLQCTDGP